jgi:hypothetical protein
LCSRHDWCGQCLSAYANSNPNGYSHSYSHTFGNANSHANTNPFRNCVHHTAAYTNGDADSFSDTWKIKTDTEAAPPSTRSTDCTLGLIPIEN